MQQTPQEHTEDCIQHHTYEDVPFGRANGRAKQATNQNLHKGPPVDELGKAEQRESHLRVGQTWTESSPGAARCGIPPTPLDHLPYGKMMGTNLEHYKRNPLPLI